jgi:hypothetical protein
MRRQMKIPQYCPILCVVKLSRMQAVICSGKIFLSAKVDQLMVESAIDHTLILMVHLRRVLKSMTAGTILN